MLQLCLLPCNRHNVRVHDSGIEPYVTIVFIAL